MQFGESLCITIIKIPLFMLWLFVELNHEIQKRTLSMHKNEELFKPHLAKKNKDTVHSCEANGKEGKRSSSLVGIFLKFHIVLLETLL